MTPGPPLRPPALARGAAIAIVSPSAALAPLFPRRFARGVEFLRAQGHPVRVMPHALDDDGLGSAGDPAARAEDLHAAFADDEVGLILCSIGGHTANTLLAHLDLDLMRRHPTWLCGYSDATALLVSLWARIGLQSLMSLQVLPQLGEFGGCLPYTWSGLSAAVGPRPGDGVHRPSDVVVTEVLGWDVADDRARATAPAPGPRAIRAGAGGGPVLAANLDVLLRLAGTEHLPDLAGHVLVLEQSETTTAGLLESLLTQLAQTVDVAALAALGFGRFAPGTNLDNAQRLDRVLARVLAGPWSAFTGPVIADLDAGHTDPQATFVLGDTVRVNALDPAHVVLQGPGLLPHAE